METDEICSVGIGHDVFAEFHVLSGLKEGGLENHARHGFGGGTFAPLHFKAFFERSAVGGGFEAYEIRLAAFETNGRSNHPVVHIDRRVIGDACAAVVYLPCRAVFVGVDDGVASESVVGAKIVEVRSFNAAEGNGVGGCGGRIQFAAVCHYRVSVLRDFIGHRNGFLETCLRGLGYGYGFAGIAGDGVCHG